MTINRTGTGLRSLDRGLLYEGNHPSFSEALEQAVKDNIDLTGLDARHQDLRRINLDGVKLAGASFEGSDLGEANMSEASFRNCAFDQAALFNTCFCYSAFHKCHFIDSRFGLTDFAGATIHDCNFGGPAVTSVNFSRVTSMRRNIYIHDRTALKMSLPPVVIHGLKNTLIFFDDKILLGAEAYDFDRRWLKDIFDLIPAQVENKWLNSTIY